MRKFNQIFGGLFLYFVCLSPALFAQAANSARAVDLDIPVFIQESAAKVKQANFRLISDYEYKMRRTINGQNGKTTSMLFESYFPSRLKKNDENRGVVIVLEENGAALPRRKIEKQRREASKNLEKAGNASTNKSISLEQKRAEGLALDWTYTVAVGLTAFLEVCKFNTPITGTTDGRETITLNFDECDVRRLPGNKSYLANLQGKIRFDAADKAPIKLAAWRKTSNESNLASQILPESAILFEQKNIAEGVWLPSLIRVTGIGNETIFPNLSLNWQIEFFDYKLPETEIKDVRINPN